MPCAAPPSSAYSTATVCPPTMSGAASAVRLAGSAANVGAGRSGVVTIASPVLAALGNNPVPAIGLSICGGSSASKPTAFHPFSRSPSTRNAMARDADCAVSRTSASSTCVNVCARSIVRTAFSRRSTAASGVWRSAGAAAAAAAEVAARAASSRNATACSRETLGKLSRKTSRLSPPSM